MEKCKPEFGKNSSDLIDKNVHELGTTALLLEIENDRLVGIIKNHVDSHCNNLGNKEHCRLSSSCPNNISDLCDSVYQKK